MKNRSMLKAALLLAVIFLPVLVQAQPGGGLDDDPGTPIDGGASLLVGAAAVYAAKKLKRTKSIKPNNKN